MKHIDAAHTRKASKRQYEKHRQKLPPGRNLPGCNLPTRNAAPELEKYIKKSDKAADRLDKAKAAIPKEKKLVKERTFDETTGKGKTRLHFEEKDKPPGFKEKHNPLSRPNTGSRILVHNKNPFCRKTPKHSFSMSQLLPIFCEPQNSDKPVGIRLSTTKDGFSSGS